MQLRTIVNFDRPRINVLPNLSVQYLRVFVVITTSLESDFVYGHFYIRLPSTGLFYTS